MSPEHQNISKKEKTEMGTKTELTTLNKIGRILKKKMQQKLFCNHVRKTMQSYCSYKDKVKMLQSVGFIFLGFATGWQHDPAANVVFYCYGQIVHRSGT